MQKQDELSFRGVLSFQRLFDRIRGSADNPDLPCRIADSEHLLSSVPELNGTIEDLAVLDRHRDWTAKLMSLVYPPFLWETEVCAAVVPFSMRPFFVSPKFKQLFLDEEGKFKGRLNMGEEVFKRGRLVRAYLFILEKFYDIRQAFDYPVIYIVSDPETGLDRHFKINMDFRFLEAHAVREPKRLSHDQIALILDHLTEPEILQDILPPEDFELRGFTLFQAVDVTASEVLSELERDLIDRESLISQVGFLRLQERLRTLFRRPDLVAGLAAVYDDQILLLNKCCNIVESCIFTDSLHMPMEAFRNSVYESAGDSETVSRFADLQARPNRTPIEEELVRSGIRSFLILPLRYQGKLIGTLDIGSPRPGDLGPMDALLASQIQPLFSMAIRRALDDFEHRIEAIIKQKCTVIHPTVEWRFRRAAMRHLEDLRMGRNSEIEPIVFRNVYPLYGVSDIRGSTDERNRAVREDLGRQLNLALSVIQTAGRFKPLLIFQELAGRISSHLERIERAPNTGDEISIATFLGEEVESIFPHLERLHPEVDRAVEAYRSSVDPLRGTVYRFRKDFDESISILSERLSTYLDQEERALQATLPHYFERHRTDGVDYLLYSGSSLLEQADGFSELYLKNLRLWQLKIACGMAWHTERLKTSLKIPLETAHLILVQNTPLSICFRFDEKRFDAEGAYDTRHEIIKSRIDKALVRGGEERLTQPGKVAIVYSHLEEAREMRLHIDLFRKQGLLTGKAENLELEDLSGVHGLKALRVAIDLASPALEAFTFDGSEPVSENASL